MFKLITLIALLSPTIYASAQPGTDDRLWGEGSVFEFRDKDGNKDGSGHVAISGPPAQRLFELGIEADPERTLPGENELGSMTSRYGGFHCSRNVHRVETIYGVSYIERSYWCAILFYGQ